MSLRVSLPLGPSKTYSFVILVHGSSRRCRLTSSRKRVNSFSRVNRSLRATSHSASDTTLEFTSLTSGFGSNVSIFILSVFVCLMFSFGKESPHCKRTESAGGRRACRKQQQITCQTRGAHKAS